jgi:hypothetical protein
MIRRATVEDTDAIVQMGARFLADGPYGRATADQHALDTFVRYLLEYGYVTCSAHGMLLGQSFLNPITAEMTAAEIAWWVDPEHRRGSHDALRLFTAFEAWAARQGARAIQVIAPVGTSLGHLYARRGYRELETIWQKRLAA